MLAFARVEPVFRLIGIEVTIDDDEARWALGYQGRTRIDAGPRAMSRTSFTPGGAP
jgi:hypothetical protein